MIASICAHSMPTMVLLSVLIDLPVPNINLHISPAMIHAVILVIIAAIIILASSKLVSMHVIGTVCKVNVKS